MAGASYRSYLESLDKKELIKLLCAGKRPAKPFAYKSHRTVALRVSYDGTNYSGVQTHSDIRSIEDELSTSIAAHGLGSELVFCGRTDAGVSAVNMVVSLRAVSRLEDPNRTYEAAESDHAEYPYDKIINELLPGDIRVTGWAPVPDDFSARHSCVERTYRYYLVRKGMDLRRMEEAIGRILDMRNFYHLSTHSNPRAIYDRKVDSLTLEKVEDSHAIEPQSMADLLRLRKSELKTLHRKNTELMGQPGYDDLYCITIRARSFLHNMVRKIVWVIKECGEGREFTTTNVRIADAYPLVFAGCRFPHALNFLGNRYSLPHFEEAEMRQRIMHQISRLRLLSFYK